MALAPLRGGNPIGITVVQHPFALGTLFAAHSLKRTTGQQRSRKRALAALDRAMDELRLAMEEELGIAVFACVADQPYSTGTAARSAERCDRPEPHRSTHPVNVANDVVPQGFLMREINDSATRPVATPQMRARLHWPSQYGSTARGAW